MMTVMSVFGTAVMSLIQVGSCREEAGDESVKTGGTLASADEKLVSILIFSQR